MTATLQLAPERGLLVALGTRRYRVHKPWPDANLKLGRLSHLCIWDHDTLVVQQRDAPHLLLLSRSGGAGIGSHSEPRLRSGHGLAPLRDGRLAVVNFDAHEICIYDRSLMLTQTLGTRDWPSWGQPFNHPTGIAEAPDGRLYVTDGYGNACTHAFSADGRWLRTWGSPGRERGQFQTPHAVWVLSDGRVVVADRDNDRLQVFDGEGQLLDIWGHFRRPMHLWGDGAGYLFVTDQTPRLTLLDEAGRVLGQAKTGGPYPHAVWGDHDGHLYLIEQGITAHQLVKWELLE